MGTNSANAVSEATAVVQEDKFQTTTDARLIASLANGKAQGCTDDLLAETIANISWAEIEVLCSVYSACDDRKWSFVQDGPRLGSETPWKEEYAANRLCYYAGLIGEEKVEEIVEDRAIRPWNPRKPKRDRTVADERLAVFRRCRGQRKGSGPSPSSVHWEQRPYPDCIAPIGDPRTGPVIGYRPAIHGPESQVTAARVTRGELEVLCHHYADCIADFYRMAELGYSGSDWSRDAVDARLRTKELEKYLDRSLVDRIYDWHWRGPGCPGGVLMAYEEEVVAYNSSRGRYETALVWQKVRLFARRRELEALVTGERWS